MAAIAMAAMYFRALLYIFIFLLFFGRLRVLNVVIHSPSVDGVSTASEYAYLRFDERFELEFVSTCLKRGRLNLARLFGFNRTSTPITRWTKHGQTTLAIPGHDPPIEITIFMDISINPGPILHKIPVRTTANRRFRNQRRRSFVNNSIQIRSRSMNNLIRIPTYKNTPFHTTGEIGSLKFSTLNARSIRNKTLIIKDFVVDYDVDITAITETWLRDNGDDLIIRELCPTGYKLVHKPRISCTGGGVGFLYKENIAIEHITYHSEFRSFECLDVTFASSNDIRTLVIYRPPCSTVNGLSVNLFLDEFSTLLEEVVISTSEFLILGDFNFHIDDKNDIHTKQFMDIIESFNCKQLVTQATHVYGHILDLVIVRDDLEDSFLNDLCVNQLCRVKQF